MPPSIVLVSVALTLVPMSKQLADDGSSIQKTSSLQQHLGKAVGVQHDSVVQLVGVRQDLDVRDICG